MNEVTGIGIQSLQSSGSINCLAFQAHQEFSELCSDPGHVGMNSTIKGVPQRHPSSQAHGTCQLGLGTYIICRPSAK